MSKRKSKTNADIRRMVQDKILEALEAGTNPWSRPWNQAETYGDPWPHNCATGHQYSGVNVPYLMAVQAIAGYPTAQWLTFNQAKKAGGYVRKGEKAQAYVVFTKPLRFKETDEDGAEKVKQIFMLRCTPVYNIAQCDNVKLPAREIVELPEPAEPGELAAQVQAFMDAAGAEVRYGGNQAFFQPGGDYIQLPDLEQFKNEEGFASTALHELVHWTGHADRCARTGVTNFEGRGSESYAKEELVAELGAAMLGYRFNVGNETENHASYIEGWIKAIKNDDRAIFEAAKRAETALNWLDEATAEALLKAA